MVMCSVTNFLYRVQCFLVFNLKKSQVHYDMLIKETVFHPTCFCKLWSEAAQRMSVKGAWL